MRWRVIFVLLALIGASSFVRHYFPMTPELREGQTQVEAKAYRVETVFEAPNEKIAAGTPREARVSGVYVSKLVETGERLRIAYREFSPPPEPPPHLAPREGDAAAGTVDSVLEKAGVAWDKSVSVAADAWRRWRTEPQAPVLLIHGIATDGRSLEAVARELAAQGVARVIVPDLPGFGSSSREAEDYSVEATAGTLFSFLDELGVSSVNVLGFGEGGGVALYMAHRRPDRVKSLALASSVGAQEFELLGNHIVNKIVYTFHLGFFKLAQDVVPHFGLMDRGNVNKAYARVLWDSDVSELKRYVREWNGPLYVAHGRDDLISPFSSAEYTVALAPQAKTHFVEGGHGALLDDPRGFADDYAAFLARLSVPAEAAKLRRADVGVPESGEFSYPPIEPAGGARVVVLMLVILVCTFVAEDPTCLASGLLVAQGLVGFVPAMTACLIGIFIGDLALYLIGRFLGRPILRKPPLKWLVSEQQIDEMSERFSKNPKGLALIVSSRFIPGSRVPTFVAAGIMKLDWHKLFILFFIAAALWTPPLILLAQYVGASVVERFKEWHHNAAWIVIGAIVVLYLVSHYVIPAFTWRGRRRHVMMRRRITRHEFWPHSILAFPVMLQFLWLGIVHRSFTVFTLAGRALGADGGVSAGSKFDRYARFLGASPLGVKTARVPAEKDLETRWTNALKILKSEKIPFPCVVKPELGDGGVGVYVARSAAHLRAWLDANVDDAVVQEYVGGNEYEVIWARRPGHRFGRVLSVVQKDFVAVKGDGERKLEDLIWADDRAVSNGKLFSKLNFRRADKVLKVGETFALAPIGSPSKGACCVVRRELCSETLARVIDGLADACGDVHFVCLDVRAEDDRALVNGTGLRVTGVKGVGAISSALFDGYVRMGKAYADSWKYLNFCFSVGAELRDDAHVRPSISAWRLFEEWGTARGRSDNYVKEPHDDGE